MSLSKTRLRISQQVKLTLTCHSLSVRINQSSCKTKAKLKKIQKKNALDLIGTAELGDNSLWFVTTRDPFHIILLISSIIIIKILIRAALTAPWLTQSCFWHVIFVSTVKFGCGATFVHMFYRVNVAHCCTQVITQSCWVLRNPWRHSVMVKEG